MSRRRTFDWDEAARRHAAGETYAEIAQRFGVTASAVRLAVNPDARARDRAAHAAWQRNGVCIDCGGPAIRHYLDHEARCRACDSALRIAVRPGEAWCSDCRAWHPLAAFNRAPTRRGVRGICVAAETARRRAYRELHPEVEAAANRRRRRAAS